MRARRVVPCTAAALVVAWVQGVFAPGVWAHEAAPDANQVKTSPPELVRSTPRGKLSNPYKDSQQAIVAEGAKRFQQYSCAGCHGGGGGGGMAPAVTNDTWIYGGDDDTLFRLVTLGSDELQKQGYRRKGQENVVGSMMPFGTIIPTSDDLWKILAFVRARYSGDPEHKFGSSPNP